MAKRFALRLTEDVSELAQYLNGGEPVNTGDDKDYFIFNITGDRIDAEAILNEKVLYDKNGYLKDSDLHII